MNIFTYRKHRPRGPMLWKLASYKKFRTWQTLNLLTCVYRSTRKRIKKNNNKKNLESHAAYPLSPVTCHYRKQPQPRSLPLLILFLCTVGVNVHSAVAGICLQRPKIFFLSRTIWDHLWAQMQIPRPVFFHTLSLRNIFVIDIFTFEICKWE